MLARSITVLSLCCLALCACKAKPSKMAKCHEDGGCPDASICEDGGLCESSEQPKAGSQAEASAAGSGGQRARTQAARATPKDAGMAMTADAAQAAEPRKASQQPKATPKQPGAAGGSSGGAKKPQAGTGGAAEPAMPTTPTTPMMMGMQEPPQAGQGGEASEPSTAACEATCEPCQACGADNKTCEPVTGADDADSCSDTRSCSSLGVCLNISQAQSELGSMLEYAELTTSYAQVISFSEPASIEEIRLEVSCTENDQSFPPVWIVAAPGGVPSNNIIATANVFAQAPTEKNTFALLELSKVLEEPETGPIALVAGMTDMNCLVRVNSENTYPGGELFMQGTTGLWLPSEGSMVFQVLSSK